MNTHRKDYLKQYQKKWIKKNRETWLKVNGPCRQCGSSYRLEVDHIDPSIKVDHRVWSWSKERREAELQKCQVLCKSCHAKKTGLQNKIALKGKPGRPLKLDESKVLEIFARAISGESPRKIGRIFSISHSTVVGIRNGTIWGWLTKADAQLELISKEAV